MFSFLASIFSGVWSKIAGFSLATASFLLFMLSRKNRKIEELEAEAHASEKESQIIDDIHLATVKQGEKVDEDVKDINTDNWRTGI